MKKLKALGPQLLRTQQRKLIGGYYGSVSGFVCCTTYTTTGCHYRIPKPSCLECECSKIYGGATILSAYWVSL